MSHMNTEQNNVILMYENDCYVQIGTLICLKQKHHLKPLFMGIILVALFH